jgi:NTP pyrophosphatase (non-canonical NTP hydrolase)
MTSFDTYQDKAIETAFYPGRDAYAYLGLGLTGEAGEVAEKFKKIIRDKEGMLDLQDRDAIAKELGDVLWYVANIANELSYRLSDIAVMNLAKLASRADRGVLKGSGDNR